LKSNSSAMRPHRILWLLVILCTVVFLFTYQGPNEHVEETESTKWKREQSKVRVSSDSNFGLNEGEKYIIMVQPFAGLGDRFRAAYMGYFLAMLTGRRLLISKSYWRGDHLKPAIGANWEDEKLLKRINASFDFQEKFIFEEKLKHNIDFSTLDLPLEKKIWELQIQTVFLNEMLDNPKVKDIETFPEAMEAIQQNRTWGWALETLFQPSIEISKAIEEIFEKQCPEKNCQFYGLHARTGDTKYLFLHRDQHSTKLISENEAEDQDFYPLKKWRESKGNKKFLKK